MNEIIKISVVSPVYNAMPFIEESILSVLKQHPDLVEEHLVVDNLSTDGTVEILQKYPHLKWIREADSGQSNAMNKAIARAKGDIIGFLNADDYYLPGAFELIAEAFKNGATVVVGQVILLFEDGSTWLNDPSVDFKDMLYHWKPNSFPNNPVGYFFDRSVIDNIGAFNEQNHLTMDLEYLLKVAQKYPITKINKPLGVYRYHPNAKTAATTNLNAYWSRENFAFIDTMFRSLPKKERTKFNIDKNAAYGRMNQFNLQIQDFLNTGESGALKEEEVLDIVRKSLKRVSGEADISFDPNQLAGFIVEHSVDETALRNHLDYLTEAFECNQFILITDARSWDNIDMSDQKNITVYTTTLNLPLLRAQVIRYAAFRYLKYSLAYCAPIGLYWKFKDEDIQSVQDITKFFDDHHLTGCSALTEHKLTNLSELIKQKNNLISDVVISGKSSFPSTAVSIGYLSKNKDTIKHDINAAILSAFKSISLKDHELAVLKMELNKQNLKIKRTSDRLKDVENSITWKIGRIILKPILFFRHLRDKI